MSENSGGMSCTLGSWALAAGAGLLTTVLLLVLGGSGFLGALFLGGVVFAVLGLLLSWLFCRPLPATGPRGETGLRAEPHHGGQAGAAGAGAAATGTAGTGTAGSAAPAAGPVDTAPSARATEAASGATTGRSAGEGGAGNAAASVDDPASDALPDVRAATADADAEAGTSVMKPSTPLPGQAELASRKGSWKYEAGGDAPPPSAAAATPEAQAAAVEGPGTKPVALSAPREGGADDLKRIKGVGPKLEKLCHSLGFYHFDQIANWTAEEVAWVDQNLEGFKGRVSRDAWVEQARLLASGGDADFSGRVNDNGVD